MDTTKAKLLEKPEIEKYEKKKNVQTVAQL